MSATAVLSRVAIFADASRSADTDWWRVVLSAPELCRVLVVAERESAAVAEAAAFRPPGACAVEWLETDGLTRGAIVARVRAWAPALVVGGADDAAGGGALVTAPMGVLVTSRSSAGGTHVSVERQFHPTSQELVCVIMGTADVTRYPRERAADVERRAREFEALLVRRALRTVARHDGAAPSYVVATGPQAVRRPVRALAKAVMGAAVLAVVRPVRDMMRTIMRRHPVHIFTYHRVSALSRDPLTISPTRFAAQLDYIARTHRVVPFAECIRLVTSGARLSRPVAAITFDDGYRSVYDFAFPAMRARGVTGTCFVSTALVGSDDRFAHDAESPVRVYLDVMDWAALRRLRAEGWSVGAHTATHARLATCDADGLERELAEPMATLRDMDLHDSGGVALAYPFGQPDDITDAARERVRAHEYRACLSNCGGENMTGTDPLTLRRIDLGSALPTLVWRARVHGLDLRTWLARYA